ncbi:cupredoxin domain-containing protein [Candidatus Woesearchaeota archaeon]|nr:cupredoxin domain-containing protein [Candidatus Woesearchaeota archaeon]
MKYSMKKESVSTSFIALVGLLFLLTGCASKQQPISVASEQASAQHLPTTVSSPAVQSSPPMERESSTILVELTDSGFSPALITIKAGQTVKFENNGATKRWPASDVHPVHASYPGSGIQKCKSAAPGSIFDACHGLDAGETFTFTFNERGAWHYHDHLDPGSKGTIVVE